METTLRLRLLLRLPLRAPYGAGERIAQAVHEEESQLLNVANPVGAVDHQVVDPVLAAKYRDLKELFKRLWV